MWQVERFVVEGAEPYLAAIKGMALSRIEEFCADKIVLVETSTAHHKTSRTSKDASKMLPLLCLGRGLYTKAWSSCWLQAREVCGLRKSRVSLPWYNEKQSCFGSSAMSTSEATLWLRELLCLTGASEKEAAKITSHGLKATLLSWCAKSGRFNEKEQRCLGHHFDPEMRSVLVYSRDSYTPLAARIRVMLDDILAGRFSPDAPRHGRIAEMVRRQMESSSASDVSDLGECASALCRQGATTFPSRFRRVWGGPSPTRSSLESSAC